MRSVWQTSPTNALSPEKASRAKSPIRGWKSRFPKPTSSSGCSRRQLGGRLQGNLLDPIKKGHKQPTLVRPVVVAEYELVAQRRTNIQGTRER